MKKNFYILLLSMIFLSSCSKKEEFLVVGTNEMFPPFGYRGGISGNDMVGFDIELAKEIAKDMDKTLVLFPMKFNDIIPALLEGKIDIALSAMAITDERNRMVDFSASYYKSSQAIIVRKDDTRFDTINTRDEITKNMVIATERGSTGTKLASQITFDKFISEINSLDLVLMELISENADAIIIDLEIARAVISKYNSLDILPIEFEIENYGVALRKGNAEMRNSINKTLERLVNSGQYIDMIEDYIRGYVAE